MVNLIPLQYIGFVEDLILVFFLLCILATLVTVHRATCHLPPANVHSATTSHTQFQVKLISDSSPLKIVLGGST